ncbi:MAG TPA: hypothetical protein VFP41_12580, partial [Actinomycetota bacterium]|nr:hypothetical protein [Actinomycetota bacterium]
MIAIGGECSSVLQMQMTARRSAIGASAVCEDVAPMGEFVRVETDGAVATIRLDRPPANALA